MKKIVMFLLALFVIAGCSNNEALQQDKYNDQLAQAEDLKDNGEYDEAKELLNTIISETKAVEYLEEQYEKAIEMLSEIEEAEGSTATTSSNSKVSIDYATEELLGKYDSYHEFVMEENGESIIFWSEESISNFNFIDIGYEMEGNKFSYFQKEILYSIDKMSPKKPVVIKTLISEGIPNRGVSYTDESGKERYFYIAWSGFDDSLSLVEFENKRPGDDSSSDSSSSNDTVSSEEFFAKTRNYLLYGQEGKSEAEKLKWSEEFLVQVEIDKVYQEYLATGGKNNDVESFARYLTFNAPINENWEELTKAHVYENYGFEITRFEPLADYDDYYHGYIEYEGKEVPYIVVSARTGYYHG